MQIKILENITASENINGSSSKLYKKNEIHDVYDRLGYILIKEKKAVEVVKENLIEINSENDLEKIIKKKDKRKTENKMFTSNKGKIENKKS